jgi:NtrC-family two-component system response regulator AlgB
VAAEEQGAPSRTRVLVIDDEKNIRTTLSMALRTLDCDVVAVESPETAVAALRTQQFDLAFLDLRLGEENGLELLPRIFERNPALPVVVITAYATIDTAVEAIQRGAVDYLSKPFTPGHIRAVLERLTRRQQLAVQVSSLSEILAPSIPEVDFTTASSAMKVVLDFIGRAAQSNAPVLLRGESGTGKGMLTRALHLQSARREGPFVTVSCPTLTEELLCSELFGHAKGSFTGAVADRPGKVEVASGGTLFLDELGEMSPAIQSRLLRFLQDKQFERVGETVTRTADVRVVGATNRDLERAVREGAFREDLLFRLNVLEVTLPPLRERREDILRLARHFLVYFAQVNKRGIPALSPAAQEMLRAYPWPGNLRELSNEIERALVIWPGNLLEPASFSSRLRQSADMPPVPALGEDFTLAEIEHEHTQRVLARCRTLEEAARILGIESSTLWRKRKRMSASHGHHGESEPTPTSSARIKDGAREPSPLGSRQAKDPSPLASRSLKDGKADADADAPRGPDGLRDPGA